MSQIVTGLEFGAWSPPTASDLSFSVNENASLNVPAPGVLANEDDPGTSACD